MTATSPPALDADLEAGLKRLKLAAMRRLAPELLVTARTQRWRPEELLRSLIEAEIAAREASNTANRRKAAGFPVEKTLAEFNVAVSSLPRPTFDYLASLEWIRAGENLALVGPAGTGKSHLLVALGLAAVVLRDTQRRLAPRRELLTVIGPHPGVLYCCAGPGSDPVAAGALDGAPTGRPPTVAGPAR